MARRQNRKVAAHEEPARSSPNVPGPKSQRKQRRGRSAHDLTGMIDVSATLLGGDYGTVLEEPLPVEAPKVRSATVTVVSGLQPGQQFQLGSSGDFVLGRGDYLPVHFDLRDQEKTEQSTVSRQHACIHFDDGEFAIEDLGSANGTFVNDRRIRPGILQRLKDRDLIGIGSIRLSLAFD